jgi:hypothetical protein
MSEEFTKRFNSLASVGFSIDHVDHEPTNAEIRAGLMRRIAQLDAEPIADAFSCAIQDTLHDTIEQDLLDEVVG